MRVPLMVSSALFRMASVASSRVCGAIVKREARGVARQAQQAGRVVEEAALVQHGELPGLQVAKRVRCGDELAGS